MRRARHPGSPGGQPMSKKRLVVIGNGMATSRLLDELLSRDACAVYDITVIGEEQGGSYNRILLGKVLSGESAERILMKSVEWYAEQAIRYLAGKRAERVDPASRTIAIECGELVPYDVAVVATGSKAFIPTIKGMAYENNLKPGLFPYRSLDDCYQIRSYMKPGDNAVVLGGGLLGLEAAKILSDSGLHVTVVQLDQALMSMQLDQRGGDMLRRQMERTGVYVRTGQTVSSISGVERVTGVLLDDGTYLPADLVVLACGIQPRTEVARASNIPCNRGVLVNDRLATGVPGIYALGECAEHDGRTYGLVAPAWEQAVVLADVLTLNDPRARYRGSKLYARLKVADVEVASMGAIEPEQENDDVVQVIRPRQDVYQKLIVRAGKLVGAMLVGDARRAPDLIQMMERGDSLPEDALEALCSPYASRLDARDSERSICNCHSVSKSAISEALSNGACSVDQVGAITRAGTGCGSCKSAIAELVAAAIARPKSRPQTDCTADVTEAAAIFSRLHVPGMRPPGGELSEESTIAAAD
jgi:nitrite reductase (NADH) large subunit